MGNRNRTLWLVAIVVIGLGLMIEAMKTSRSSTAAGARSRVGLFGFASSLEDDSSADLGRNGRRVTSQQLAADRARQRLKGRLAGLDSDLDSTPTTNAAAQPAATPAGPANLANPVTINTAEAAKEAAKKKAEADKKKKKKKKKKTVVTQTPNGPVVTVTEKSDDGDDDFPYGSTSGSGTSTIRTVIAGAAAKEETTTEPETLEDWLAFILREPSYERTMKMVDAVQSRRLDPSIFHDVITEMLADSREKMHEHAILALGSYPSLKSFLLLQSFNSSAPEASQLKVQSRNHLKSYSRIENLRFLASLISTSGVDSNVLFEALRLIHLSANFYSGQTSSSSTGSPTPPKPAATPATVVRQFNPLVPVLNRIAQTSNDSSIRQEASQALRQVQVITGT